MMVRWWIATDLVQPGKFIPLLTRPRTIAVQVRQLAERGLRPEAATPPSLIAESPAATPAPSTAPSLAAMLRMTRARHPSLAKPPNRAALSLPGPSFLALLRYLDTLSEAPEAPASGVKIEQAENAAEAAQPAGDDDAAMEVDGDFDQESVGAGDDVDGTRFGDAYLLILEHALVRCAYCDHVDIIIVHRCCKYVLRLHLAYYVLRLHLAYYVLRLHLACCQLADSEWSLAIVTRA